MRISGGGELQPPRVLRALEALKKAASQLHQEAAAVTEDSEEEGGSEDDTGDAVCGSPSMRALLEVERQSEGLLGDDPDLEPLAGHLSRLRAACSAARPRKPSASSSSSFLPASLASLLGLRARDEGDGEGEEIARVAAGIEEEIQAWIDRENTHRVAAALRSLMRPSSTATTAERAKGGGGEEQVPNGCHHLQRQLLDTDEDESAVASLLSAMESRLSRGFDSRYQSALLRSGAFPSLLAALTAPPTTTTSKLTRESCASAVAAAVRFNPAVFVGPVLACSSPSSSVARSLTGMATPNSARALGALVSAIRTPLVDEMEARGEVPSVVALLRKPAELAAAAMGAVMVMGRHGRREAVWAMLDAGVVEKLVELELEYGPDEEDDENQEVVRSLWKKKLGVVKAGEVGIIDVVHHAMPTGDSVSFQGCVTRFAIQVQTGRGMGRRDKREARAELVRRIRAAADADNRAGNILAEVLWDIT